jgi:hypothetical protein
MLPIRKQTIINQDNEITSVIISYNDFLKLEELIENFGLNKLMNEVQPDDYLDISEARKFYSNLEGNKVGDKVFQKIS